MHAEFVSTRDGSLLRGVRQALTGADRVLICVAFAAESGVRLLQTELEALRKQRRPVQLVATTAFSTTTPAALSLARDLGVDVRTHNASRGTFHPKVYLGIRDGGRARAVIGSANLTSGLAGNVEAGMALDGTLRDQPIARAWEWAEACLDNPITEYWAPRKDEQLEDEQLEPELFSALQREVRKDSVFYTLGRVPRPNRVESLTRTEVWLHTERSLGQGGRPQPVPAWMLNVAWAYLRTSGKLMNAHLLNELRVHRSSAVCALLARLPGVAPVVEGARIGLVRAH